MTESERQLKKNIEAFSVLAAKVADNPNSKDVHQLRILSRKLRAALWIYSKGSKIQPPSRLKKNLQSLGKTLGTNRELDVLLKDMEAYKIKDQKSEKKKDKEFQKLPKFLAKSFRSELESDLKIFLTKTQGVSLVKKDLLKQIRKGIGKWPKKIPTDKKALHEIRIETKKMIYRMEILSMKAPLLKSLQKSLGRTHDLERLQKKVGTHKKVDHDMELLLKRAKDSYKKITA